ncbi:MAG: ATP synthase F1 subunit delta [Rhodothermales bacterium]
MNNLSIARRYAQALAEHARSEGLVAQLDKDLRLIEETLAGSRDLRNVFESPVISTDKKLQIVRQLFGSRVSAITRQFLELTVNKGRENQLKSIVEAYRRLRDDEEGIVEAHVRVAGVLEEDARRAMNRRLETVTGKQVRLQVVHDRELIGGAVVRIGDTVYDGSVRNKLSLLREQMERGQISIN